MISIFIFKNKNKANKALKSIKVFFTKNIYLYKKYTLNISIQSHLENNREILPDIRQWRYTVCDTLMQIL